MNAEITVSTNSLNGQAASVSMIESGGFVVSWMQAIASILNNLVGQETE